MQESYPKPLSKAFTPARSERQRAVTYRKQIDVVRRVVESTPQHVTVLPVSYDEALTDPNKVAETVNEFLGDGVDEWAMTAIVVPEMRRH
jgi:hypothetical protein